MLHIYSKVTMYFKLIFNIIIESYPRAPEGKKADDPTLLLRQYRLGDVEYSNKYIIWLDPGPQA